MSDASKTCSICGALKPLSEYGKHSKAKDGLQQQCKPCRAERRKITDATYRERNRDRLREYHAEKSRERRAANPEKSREYHRNYYASNLEKSREQSRKSEGRRRQRMPDEVKEIQERAARKAREKANAAKVKDGPWLEWEDGIALNPALSAVEVAVRLGRGLGAVTGRRRRLRDAETVREKARNQERRDFSKTRPRASNWGKEWSGPELEVVADYRLSAVEAALLLGRTASAVEHQRGHLNRNDPKKAFLAGLPIGDRSQP